MPKAEVISLVGVLGNNQADAAQVLREYDLVMQELGEQPVLTVAAIVSLKKDQPVYFVNDDMIYLLAVLFDARDLARASIQALDAVVGKDWRSSTGSPRTYLTEQLGHNRLQFYPTPDRDSTTVGLPFGDPLGDDYPIDAGVAIYTQFRQDAPGWLDLWLALRICERCFARDNIGGDAEMSLMSKTIGGVVAEGVMI